MTIALSPETQQLLDERLKAGPYASPDDAVRQGLLLLLQKERDDAAALRELKAKLERAAARAERGADVDPDDVLKKIEALKQRRLGRAG